MRPHAPEGPDDISPRQNVPEGPEHAKDRIELLPKPERTHVRPDESHAHSGFGRLFSGHREHGGGLIEAGDPVAAASQGDVVISCPASQVENRPRLHTIPSEDGFEEIHIAFVVHEPMVDDVIVSRESAVRRMRSRGHAGARNPRGRMMLWLPDNDRAVVRLERLEVAEVDHFDAGLDQRAFRRLENLTGRRGDVGRSRLHHQEPGSTGSHELEVPDEDPFLVPLGDVLVHDVHGADPAGVRFWLRGVAENRHQIRPLLRQSEKIPEGPRGDFDRGDRAVRADVRDMARGGPAARAQVEDR